MIRTTSCSTVATSRLVSTTTATPTLELEHCIIGSHRGVGLVIIKSAGHHRQQRSSEQDEKEERPNIFQVRMVGSEIATLPVRYCFGGFAVSSYRLARTGAYHVEVLKLYDQFDYDGYNYIDISQFRAFGFKISVEGPRIRDDDNDVCRPPGHESESSGTVGAHPLSSCPPCRPHDAVRGHWLAPRPEEASLFHHMCVWTHTHPTNPRSGGKNASAGIPIAGLESSGVQECHLKFGLTTSMSTWHRASDLGKSFTWHSQRCHIALPQSPSERVSCLRNKYFCFVGDSHMRLSYNFFVSHMNPSPILKKMLNLQNIHRPLPASFAGYFEDDFGYKLSSNFSKNSNFSR